MFDGRKLDLGGGDILQVSSLNNPSPQQPRDKRVALTMQMPSQFIVMPMSPDHALELAEQLTEHVVESWYVMGFSTRQVREFLAGSRLAAFVGTPSPPPTDFETQRQLEVVRQLEALQAENARLRAVIAETHRLTADPDQVE